MKLHAPAMLLLAGALPGCPLPGANEVAGQPVNSCNTDGDCAQGSACVQGRCVATSYDLTGMLFEIRPNPAGVFAPGTSYIVDPGAAGVKLKSNGDGLPLATQLTIQLPPPVSIRGAAVKLDPSYPAACGGPDGSVSANVTFYRVPEFAGLLVAPVYASHGTSAYTFDVDLVSGPDDRWDVYIEPYSISPGCTPAMPPFLVPGQAVDASNTVWHMPPPGTLTGAIAGLSAAEWRLDVVEPSRGLVVSSGSTLMAGSGGATILPMPFSPPFDPSQSPVLRLSPITGAGTLDPSRPTVFWTLAGAIKSGTSTDPVVMLTYDLAATGPSVEGQVFASDGVTGVASQLIIQSIALDSQDLSQNASFTINGLRTGGPLPGEFSVPVLPPGDYTVRAAPDADSLDAITDSTLTIPADGGSPDAGSTCACGKSIGLREKEAFTAHAKTPTGVPLTATTVQVVGSVGPARSYLETTHALPPLPARTFVSSTNGAGDFSMLIDRGTSDLFIQPDPATGFSWLVLPRFPPGATPPTFTLPNPGFVTGFLVDPTGAPIANAAMEAYLPVKVPGPSNLVGTVVMIASTSTDDSGAFTLVLPSFAQAP